MTTVPVVDVGQPMQWSEPLSTLVNFHEFESLGSTKGVRIESPTFRLHGKEWSVQLYPGGNTEAKDGFVSCYLECQEETSTPITTKYSLSVSTMDKTVVLQSDFRPSSTWGKHDFIERSKLIEKGLDDRSFRLEVSIQIRIPKPKGRSILKQDDLHVDMMCLLRSKQCADVVFEFGNGETLHAHLPILFARAPLLAELVQGEGSTTVPIENISHNTFKRFLEFLYASEMTPGDTLPEAKEMLEVANRFGVIKLKLMMESHLVDKYLTYESAIALLLFADSCSCALLREEAMTVGAQHIKKLQQTDGWDVLKGNVDLFTEMVEYDPNSERDDELPNLSVGQIYEELLAFGAMPIDGSRKILVQKLVELRETKDAEGSADAEGSTEAEESTHNGNAE